MSARYRLGTASTIASTSRTDSGTTSASLHLGSVIPMHGEEASSRSPTAALKIVATHRYTSSTDRGAKTEVSSFTHACTSLRRIAPSWRVPSYG